MADIFISYKREDSETHRDALVELLHIIYGRDCLWFDEDIQGGANWQDAITLEIGKCKLFIILISDKSIKSEWCAKECTLAFEKHKHILPVYLPNFTSTSKEPELELSDLHKELATKQVVDLRKGYSESKISANLWKAVNSYIFDSETTLSKMERILLVNQFENLNKASPDQGYEIAAKIFARGYEGHYDDAIPRVSSEVISVDECQEVQDILTMFDFMDRFIQSHGSDPDIDENDIKYIGFDGNYNARYRDYLTIFGRG